MNQEHYDLLKQGAGVWNAWRKKHPDIHPDLSRADLSRADLNGTDLSFANLYRAHLSAKARVSLVLSSYPSQVGSSPKDACSLL